MVEPVAKPGKWLVASSNVANALVQLLCARSFRVGEGLRPRQVLMAIGRVCASGEYIRSGQDADDPAARSARIRAEMADLLTLPGLDIPAAAMDPYLDFIAAKIALDTTPATTAQT